MGWQEVSDIKSIFTKLDTNRVANFAYTDNAFANDVIDGVESFDVSKEMNVPLKTKTDFNSSVLNKGARSQAASLSRNGINHFFGRLSYNVNKTIQKLSSFLSLYESECAHNSHEYDAKAEYQINDVCYKIDAVLDKINWYQRISGAGVIGKPPENDVYWKQLLPLSIKNVFVSLEVSAANTQEFSMTDLALDSERAYNFIPSIAEDDKHFRNVFVSRSASDKIKVSVWSVKDDGAVINGAWDVKGGEESSFLGQWKLGKGKLGYDGGLKPIKINIACFDAGEYEEE